MTSLTKVKTDILIILHIQSLVKIQILLLGIEDVVTSKRRYFLGSLYKTKLHYFKLSDALALVVFLCAYTAVYPGNMIIQDMLSAVPSLQT